MAVVHVESSRVNEDAGALMGWGSDGLGLSWVGAVMGWGSDGLGL
jgi:hypothetical protein